ncbi:MAG TPA: ABC transporter ATP-binding protein [Cytophagales bacterium]|nr:ABC transporter ATP-binding protein [Cytophagales bacterium]HAP62596.1 ABC transporter ATP-binding protein [Cytophagales bacterium]
MLAIQNLTYHLGGRTLYEEASLHIKPKDKIALVGLNGTGKSTLLRLINAEMPPDGGEISKSKETSIGFLNQDLLSYQTEDSILEVALTAFEETLRLEKEINALLKKMETEYSDDLVDKLGKLQERYEAQDGYVIQSRAEEILEGIGFKTQDLHRPLKEFSGGWRMRVMLAKLLLEKPSLLMLDEPTNHLDLPSIEWVEKYLSSYEGAVIVVSHDREFLDNCTTTTVEVANQQLTLYSGNYSFYLEERELRREIQQNAFENQQQQIKQAEQFVNRFRAKATKARQVQSRVKMLEKMDRIDQVVDEFATVNFQFKFQQKSGRFVVTLKDVDKAYGDLQILKQSDGVIERGDKIALIGANGKGKSTLLRIIAGTEGHEGTREEGYNVIPAFYAQHQLEALSVNNEILEELKQAGSAKTELELRTILGAFLFQNDDVFKKIKVLSGGEKSRVALAKTLISEANFLLLDEPTNHLDMQSVNILVQALQHYEGSYIIVSHDRYFVSQVANKIWWIEDQELKEYPGTYEEWADWAENRRIMQDAQAEKAQATVKLEKPKVAQKQRTLTKEHGRELKKLQKELEDLEQQVLELETEKESLEAEMAEPSVYSNPDLLLEKNERYAKLDESLIQKNEQWEEVALQIEELEG